MTGGGVTYGYDAIRDHTDAHFESCIALASTAASCCAALGAPVVSSDTPAAKEIGMLASADIDQRPVNFVPIAGLLFGGADVVKRDVTILFDTQRRVEKFNMNQSAVSTDTGLLAR